MAVEVFEFSQSEAQDLGMGQFALWVEDFDSAMIDCLYIALDDGEPIGFQTINGDGLCVAIEVADSFLGQGIASAIVEKSGCYRPEDNQCPDFWEKMEEIYGY